MTLQKVTSTRFWLVRINNATASISALLLLASSPVAASSVHQNGNDLLAVVGMHRVVVHACPNERLFANARALSPNGRWLIGHATYEPRAAHMVAEYGFVVHIPTGRRILDRDFERAFNAPGSNGDEQWLPKRPASLRYTPASPRPGPEPVTLDLPALRHSFP